MINPDDLQERITVLLSKEGYRVVTTDRDISKRRIIMEAADKDGKTLHLDMGY
ncbi:MAG: hypothetical protein JKX85_05220 [Phycisphaeraceae bacterium]|nr:hypothetical protein [Phycisphaeraceae bacterium]